GYGSANGQAIGSAHIETGDCRPFLEQTAAFLIRLFFAFVVLDYLHHVSARTNPLKQIGKACDSPTMILGVQIARDHRYIGTGRNESAQQLSRQPPSHFSVYTYGCRPPA